MKKIVYVTDMKSKPKHCNNCDFAYTDCEVEYKNCPLLEIEIPIEEVKDLDG